MTQHNYTTAVEKAFVFRMVVLEVVSFELR
jgi:hypothetical protein